MLHVFFILFNHDPEKLEIILVQFANLYRGGKKVQMSTRSGSFVTLEDLRNEVGNDAARFFYILRKSEQHMDFDLDLAKSKTNENPVFYIQYAYARISSVFRQAQDKGINFNHKGADLSLLLPMRIQFSISNMHMPVLVLYSDKHKIKE